MLDPAPDAPPPPTSPVPAVPPPLRVMVASSVYGFEDELGQIVAMLRTYGDTVWNSHVGTIPTGPRRSNLENCLDAVRQCGVFVGLIRPFYGSGVIGPSSITHEEMRLAVALDKPRWVLALENVFLARQRLRPFLPHFAPPGSPPPPRERPAGVLLRRSATPRCCPSRRSGTARSSTTSASSTCSPR